MTTETLSGPHHTDPRLIHDGPTQLLPPPGPRPSPLPRPDLADTLITPLPSRQFVLLPDGLTDPGDAPPPPRPLPNPGPPPAPQGKTLLPLPPRGGEGGSVFPASPAASLREVSGLRRSEPYSASRHRRGLVALVARRGYKGLHRAGAN